MANRREDGMQDNALMRESECDKLTEDPWRRLRMAEANG
jgi:hypothetical protein